MSIATTTIDELRPRELTRVIKRTMRNAAQDAFRLGYMLNRVKEERLYANDYSDFDSYLAEELHIDYTTATRLIRINKKYAVPGDGMEIADQYENYSQGLLIEMLNMTPEQEAKVTPDMTVKQAREIKKQDRTDARVTETVQEPEKVATSQLDTKAEVHGESWFVLKYYRSATPEKKAKLSAICREEKNNADRGRAMQRYLAPYGYSGGDGYIFYGFAKGIDFWIKPQLNSVYASEGMHMTYTRFAAELMKILESEWAERQSLEPIIRQAAFPGEPSEEDLPKEEVIDAEFREIDDSEVQEKVATSQSLSAHGLPITEYPSDSLISTEGCGHKYTCFSCSMECGIRQKERYCREAPLGNPFECDTMNMIVNLRSVIGTQCQFVDQDLAYHRSGDNEPSPCCKDCMNPCRYQCERAAEKREKDEAEEKIATSQLDENADMQNAEEVPSGVEGVKCILEEQKKLLNEMLLVDKVDPLPKMVVFKQKTIVGALAAMICDLEREEEEAEQQPELPVLKNNDQRKEWLDDYKAWGLWYRDEHIDVNYYKYDFSDGSRLVVEEYPQRELYTDIKKDFSYYHLIGPGKKYRNYATSTTDMTEFLKELQKK